MTENYLGDILFLKIENNEDHGYLHFLTQGISTFPDLFKLSPEDKVLAEFPSVGIDREFTLSAIYLNKLVGVVTFTSLADRIKLSHIGEVSRMYVDGQVQGKQVGYRLFTELLNTVRRNFSGIRHIKLNVATHNHNAKKLYSKLGFKHLSTEKECIKFGDNFLDDDTMILFLNQS